MINFEEIWKLLSEYKFEIDSQLLPHVKCIICNEILIDAYQGPCGCKYCKKCITNYLGDGDKFCFGDADECKLTKLNINGIVKDNATNRIISQLEVNCPLDGCVYRSKVILVVDHLRVCEQKSVLCPFHEMGCTVKLLKQEIMANHLLKEINHHSNLMVEWMKKLKNDLISDFTAIQQGLFEKELQNVEHLVNLKISEALKQDREKRKFRKDISEIGTKEMINYRDSCEFMDETLTDGYRNEINSGSVSLHKTNDITLFEWEVKHKFSSINSTIPIRSNDFFSKNGICQMWLEFHPTGCRFHQSTYVCIEFCLKKGPIKLSSWPILANISITIRNIGQFHVHKMKSKRCKIFRPRFWSNWKEYFHFSIFELMQAGVIVDNSISIDCIVDVVQQSSSWSLFDGTNSTSE